MGAKKGGLGAAKKSAAIDFDALEEQAKTSEALRSRQTTEVQAQKNMVAVENADKELETYACVFFPPFCVRGWDIFCLVFCDRWVRLYMVIVFLVTLLSGSPDMCMLRSYCYVPICDAYAVCVVV